MTSVMGRCFFVQIQNSDTWDVQLGYSQMDAAVRFAMYWVDTGYDCPSALYVADTRPSDERAYRMSDEERAEHSIRAYSVTAKTTYTAEALK
jgi:hypothetical protein